MHSFHSSVVSQGECKFHIFENEKSFTLLTLMCNIPCDQNIQHLCNVLNTISTIAHMLNLSCIHNLLSNLYVYIKGLMRFTQEPEFNLRVCSTFPELVLTVCLWGIYILPVKVQWHHCLLLRFYTFKNLDSYHSSCGQQIYIHAAFLIYHYLIAVYLHNVYYIFLFLRELT